MVDQGYKDAAKFFEKWDSNLGLVSPKLKRRARDQRTKEGRSPPPRLLIPKSKKSVDHTIEDAPPSVTPPEVSGNGAQAQPEAKKQQTPTGITLPVVKLDEEVEQSWLRVGYLLSFLVVAPWLVWGHYFVGGAV